MSVPLTYGELTAAERAKICNGCGPRGGPDLPDFIFYDSCCRHDFDYWSGFTAQDRKRADDRFLSNMLGDVDLYKGSWFAKQCYRFVAWRYYAAVRLFGSMSFRNRGRYATREDFERDFGDRQRLS